MNTSCNIFARWMTQNYINDKSTLFQVMVLCQRATSNYPSQSWPRYMSAYGVCPLRWRHNDHNGVSNHQPHGCLHNRLFGRRSKKTSKLRVTGLCMGNSPGPVNSPHKRPVTRKMFPFDDVIMHNESNIKTPNQVTLRSSSRLSYYIS